MLQKRSSLASIALALLFASALAWAGEPIWIDVRSPGEFDSGHVEGSINIPHTEIVERIGEVTADKDATLYLYCRSGNRSEEAGKLLIEHGFRHVYNVEHGFEGELDENHHRSTVSGWRHDGLPWEQC